MNDEPTIPPTGDSKFPPDPLSVLRQVDHRCDEFESAWKKSRDEQAVVPQLKKSLGGSTDKEFILSMIAIDWEYRRQLKLNPQLEDYAFEKITAADLARFIERSIHLASKKPRLAAQPDDSQSPTIRPAGRTQSEIVTHELAGPGKTFGNYDILEEIARGGMGVVFKARDRKLNRLCALKMILSGQLAGQEELQRFYTEAESAANLEHPGIVPVFDVGSVDGQHYYSMGYVDGVSLSEKTKNGPLAPDVAAHLTRQVAEAIAHAHSFGVIHRDLKPANVLIDAAGNPKVTDFGLAKKSGGDSNLTATGQILGTPSYMPPEQAASDLEAVDAQSDLYSLGAILYCLITGRPPFQSANQMDILLQVLESEPVPPSKLNAAVPKDLETICLKCLAKDKSKRYANVNELVAELNRFENGEPILARPVSQIEKTVRWCKRKPAAAAAILLAGLFTMLLIVAGPWIAIQQSRIASQKTRFAAQQMQLTEQAKSAQAAETLARDEAEQEAEKAKLAQTEAVRARDETEKKVYARTTALAYQQWRANNSYLAEALLNQTDPNLRGWEWDYVRKLSNSETKTLIGLGSPARQVVMLADGVHVAAMEKPNFGRGSIQIWNFQTGELSIQHPQRNGLAFSTDGRLFAAIGTADNSKFQIYETLSGKKVLAVAGHGNLTSNAAFSPDGKWIASCGADSTVKIWDLSNGKLTTDIQEKNRQQTHEVCWSEDSAWVGWKPSTGQIYIHDADSGKLVFEANDPIYRSDTSSIAIHRSAGIVASTSVESINLFDIKTQKRTGALYGHQSSVTQLAFFKDGSKLVSTGVDVSIRVWDLKQAREVSCFRGHKIGGIYGMTALAISGDEKWIISGGQDTMVKVWPVAVDALKEGNEVLSLGVKLPATSAEVDFLFGFTAPVQSVAISTDGKIAVGGSRDKSVRLFDLQTRKQSLEFLGHDQSVGAVAISPDNQLVASGTGGIVNREGGTILVWKTDDRKVVHRFKLDGPVSGLKFTPDGKKLIASTGSQFIATGEVAVWEMESEKLLYQKSLESVTMISLRPDGEKLAIATLGKTYLMDVETGEYDWNIQEPGAAFSIAYSSDKKYLALGKRSWGVGLYDASNGERIWERVEHTGVVAGIAFIDNGKRIVSGATDKSTQVWNTETGDVLLSLRLDGFESFGITPLPDQMAFLEYGEAPFISIRETENRHPNIEPAKMRTLYADDFDGSTLSEEWLLSAGSCEVKNGVAVGKLENLITIPGYVATMISLDRAVPTNVEVEYDVWADHPLMFQTVLGDQEARSNISSLYIGKPAVWVNNGRAGVCAAVWFNFSNDFSNVTDHGFQFEPGRKYRLKSVRKGDSWLTFCDGNLLIERKIPAGLALTRVAIAGAFGNEGETINFDNLVIRVPDDEETKRELAAIELESYLFRALKSKYLITQAIENDKSLSDEIRRLALQQASSRVESNESRQAVFQELVTNEFQVDERLQPADVYRALIRSLKSELDNGTKSWTQLSVLSAAHLRTGEYESALDVAAQADQERQRLFGSSTPMIQAVIAIANAELKRDDAATKAFSNLVEFHRSRQWNPELAAPSNELAPAAGKWFANAKQLLPSSITQPILNPAPDIAEIKRLTFEPQQAMELEYDNAGFIAAHDPEALIINGRTQTPNEYDIEIPFAKWSEAMKLWNQGAPSLETSFTRENVRIWIEGDTATLIGDYCYWIPFGHWKYEQQNELKKTPDGWKITRRRHGLTGLRIGEEILVASNEDWAVLDDKANKLRDEYAASDKTAPRQMMDLSVLLKRAGRENELHALLMDWKSKTDLIKNPGVKQAYWRSLAESAWSIGESQQMISATEECVAGKTQLVGPPFLVAAAARNAFPSEPIDAGHGMKLKVPLFFEKGPATDQYTPGDPLLQYRPSNKSSFGITWKQETFATHQDFVNAFNEGPVNQFQAVLKAQIHHQDAYQVDGGEALEVIMEANGDGMKLTPATTLAQGQGTIVRLVVISHYDNTFIIQMTADKQEFNFRNSEFQAILESIELDPRD